MRGVDQRLQVVRRAIAAVGRERQHAVVAPVALAGKIVDRHQLDGGDAQRGEVGQGCLHAVEAAQSADMQLVEHRLVPRPAAPRRMLPAIGARVDDEARAMDVVGLGARRGIGHREAVGQAVAIARAGAAGRLGFEPALGRSASSATAGWPSISTATWCCAGAHRRKRVRSGAISVAPKGRSRANPLTIPFPCAGCASARRCARRPRSPRRRGRAPARRVGRCRSAGAPAGRAAAGGSYGPRRWH